MPARQLQPGDEVHLPGAGCWVIIFRVERNATRVRVYAAAARSFDPITAEFRAGETVYVRE